jgi:hypothetical protein
VLELHVQPLRDRLRRERTAAARQDGELVAAEASEAVALAEPRAPHFGGPPEHLVAGGVTCAVVDLLEVVEVEQGNGERFPRPAGIGDRGGESSASQARRFSTPVKASSRSSSPYTRRRAVRSWICATKCWGTASASRTSEIDSCTQTMVPRLT